MKLRSLHLLILFSCSSQTVKVEDSLHLDSVDFPFTNPPSLTSEFHSEQKLDSLARIIISNKIVPDHFYKASYLARFNNFKNYQVIGIETLADDWSKSFLVSLDNYRQLVDFTEITDSYGDATQKKGIETVTERSMSTNFTNDSSFVKTIIQKTIYNYNDANEITEKDSINEYYLITDAGKFQRTKKDSTRSLIAKKPSDK